MNNLVFTVPWLVPLAFYLFLFLQELVPTLLTLLTQGFNYVEVIPTCMFCLYMAYCCFYKAKTSEIVVFSLDGLFLLVMAYYLLYVVPMLFQLWWIQYSEYTLTGTLEIPPKSLTKYYISLLFVLFVGKANCMNRREPLKKRTPNPLKKGGSRFPSTDKGTPDVQKGPLAQTLVERSVESTLPVAVGTSVAVGSDRFLSHGFLGASKQTGPSWLGLAGKKLAAASLGALAGYGVYASLSESGRRINPPREYPGLTDQHENGLITDVNRARSTSLTSSESHTNTIWQEAHGSWARLEKGDIPSSPKFKLDEFDVPPF